MTNNIAEYSPSAIKYKTALEQIHDVDAFEPRDPRAEWIFHGDELYVARAQIEPRRNVAKSNDAQATPIFSLDFEHYDVEPQERWHLNGAGFLIKLECNKIDPIDEPASVEKFDFDALMDFAASLGLDWTGLALQSYPEKGTGAPVYGKVAKARGIAPGCEPHVIADHDSSRMAICVSVIGSARKADEIEAVPVLVAEFDKDMPTEWPSGCYPTHVVETSPGHFHVYWKLAKAINLEAARAILRGVVDKMGAEKEMLATFWMPRAVGSIHRKIASRPHRVADVTADFRTVFAERPESADPERLADVFGRPVVTQSEPVAATPASPAPLTAKPYTGRPHLSYEPPSHARDLKEAAEILAVIPADDRLKQWLPAGQMLCGWLGSDGLRMWDQWSSFSSKYAKNEPGRIEQEWKRFNRLKGYFRNPKAALLALASRYQSDICSVMGRKYPDGKATSFSREHDEITRTAPSRPRTTGFVMLTNDRNDKAKWLALSSLARDAYIRVILPAHNGSNNGNIHVSGRSVAKELGCNPNYGAKALNELDKAGFIYTTRNYVRPPKKKGQKDAITGQGKCRLIGVAEFGSDHDGKQYRKAPKLVWANEQVAAIYSNDPIEAERTRKTLNRAERARRNKRLG